MKNNWILKSVLLGLVFFAAVLLVKPVGVSTQFSMLSGLFHNSVITNTITVVDEDKKIYSSTNAYYDKSNGKLIKAMQQPLNYDFVFVLAIPLGAYAAARLLQKAQPASAMPQASAARLFLNGFAGGFIVLYGSRMAGGCTSGHMMSGIMQGSVSGLFFAAAVFLTAIPTAILVKKYFAKDDRK